MTATTTAHNSTAAREIRQALAQNRLDEAEQLLADWTGELPQDLALLAADVHVKRHRFAQARAILDGLGDVDLHVRLKRTAARNYAALQLHRPEIFARLIAANISDRYRLVPVAGNRLTLADVSNPAKPLLLTPGGDPVAAVQKTLTQLESRMKDGAAVGLVGIGDGYVLGTLSRITPKLFMDMQVCVHLLEPDLSLLHLCLVLHDYSGPQGPIEQRRFQWYVGDDWDKQYAAALRDDSMLPRPGVIVQQSTHRARITPMVHEVAALLDQQEAEAWAESERYYASITAGDLAARFEGRTTDRPPRVLLLTSRFTTVLQYATRGIASAFESLQWQTLTLIEPTPYHQVSKLTLHQAVARFKPDLVFQIDHLRHEHEECFPENLPFACWIQDHLPHLTKIESGQQLKSRDFVLAFASPLFIDTYRYPARQCIDMPMMLTSPRGSEQTKRTDAADLVYVSNVSQQPQAIADKLVARTAEPWRPLIADAVQALLDHYDSGNSVAGHHDLRGLLDEIISRGRHAQPDEATRRRFIEDLWNPLNIALYRQQALRWVADAAKSLDLSLGIYGQGWDQHPAFAAFAKGTIENGEPLARLTRSAKINLNLEPYVCFTHQRLLDGLAAGGFYLVREHPGNELLQELLNFIEEHCGADVQTLTQAMQRCVPAHRAALAKLAERAAGSTFDDGADAVRQVRCWQRAGVLIRQEAALPHLRDVSFHDKASCHALIHRFMQADEQRRQIAESQRRSVESRLSFASGIRMVTKRIASLLSQEALDEQAPASPLRSPSPTTEAA